MSESALHFFQSDEQLKDIDFAKYQTVPSNEAIHHAKAALEAKNHKVTIVETRAEALEAVKNAVPKGASVMNAGSVTLSEIGLTEHLKHQSEWVNLHEQILAEKDQQKAADLRRHSITADYFFSSVCAVSETGDFVVVDLTGSRTGAFSFSAGHLVLVVGANKIVPTYEDAVARAHNFCLPMESARVRVAYKVPASSINNFVAIRGGNPWGAPGRFHLIIVKEVLGY